jgi:hypothetical protein
MRGAGHLAHMKEMRNAYSILFVKYERKKPLESCRRKWENNI